MKIGEWRKAKGGWIIKRKGPGFRIYSSLAGGEGPFNSYNEAKKILETRHVEKT